MSGFKLIAIRPTTGCNKDFLKILSVNKPYVFYNYYDFSNYSDKNRILSKRKDYDVVDIYSYLKGRSKVHINVSALVGQNGSGKSSLVELFYVACFNISAIKEVLFDERNQIRLTAKNIVKGINVEIFFEDNDEVFLLKLHGTVLQMFSLNGNEFSATSLNFDLNVFFYTIAINYSLHSLNSDVLGRWIDKVFHKNDGYQTPIVLNPYREHGVININKEEYLIKSRLITNILGRTDRKAKIEDSLRNIIVNKIAYRLHVSISRDKFVFDKSGSPTFEKTKLHGSKLLPLVYEYFLKNKSYSPPVTPLNNYAQEYIISKLISIAEKYQPYKSLFQFFYEPEGDAETYIQILSTDTSHVTFKLRQAINFLQNELYFKRKEQFDLTVAYLSRTLNSKSNQQKKQLIELLPPAFFDVDIEFKGGDFFNQLSSGEKQRVYSLSTLLYHLSNVDSASQLVTYKYKSVNIIFDELELYFHPDLQRNLVNDIIEGIKKLNLKSVHKINILFITHSPFILSDISKHNTLILDNDGTPSEEGLDVETFGANIFDLLKHTFFLENGPMGEFAKNKINYTLDWINNPKRNLQDKDYHRSVIQMIGEPILKIKLAEMFDEAVNDNLEKQLIKNQILYLQNKLKN